MRLFSFLLLFACRAGASSVGLQSVDGDGQALTLTTDKLALIADGIDTAQLLVGGASPLAAVEAQIVPAGCVSAPTMADATGAAVLSLQCSAVGAYEIVAQSLGITSDSVGISAVTGAAARLAFVSPPTTIVERTPFALQVEVQDAQGRHVDTNPGTTRANLDPGSAYLRLLGQVSTTGSAGNAQWSGLHIDAPATQVQLRATAAALQPATAQVEVTPASYSQSGVATVDCATAGQASLSADGVFASVTDGSAESTDGGLTWLRLSPVPTGYGGSYRPISATRLWVAQYAQSFRSDNGGSSWETLTLPSGGMIYTAVLPGTPAVLLATSQSESVVSRSTDDGQTWTGVPIATGMGPLYFVGDIAARASRVYTSGWNDDVFDALYTSADAGLSWSRCAQAGFPAGDTPAWVAALENDVVLVYTDTGLYRSTNACASFTAVVGTTAYGQLVMSAQRRPYSFDSTSGSWSVSDATGSSWTALPSLPSGASLQVVDDRSAPTRIYYSLNNALFSRSEMGGTPIKATTGLRTCSPNAQEVSPTQPNNRVILVRDGTTRIMYTRDGGGTWSAATGPSHDEFLWSRAEPNVVFSYGIGGVSKSSDSGATWTDFNAGLPPGAWIISMAIDPTNANIMYAIQNGIQTIWRTTSSNGPWSNTGGSVGPTGYPNHITVRQPSAGAPEFIVAVFDSGSTLFKSVLSGQTNWLQVGSIASHYTRGFASPAQHPDVLYMVANTATVWRSVNGGGTWAQIGDDPSSYDPSGMAVSADDSEIVLALNKVFRLRKVGGVFETTFQTLATPAGTAASRVHALPGGYWLTGNGMFTFTP